MYNKLTYKPSRFGMHGTKLRPKRGDQTGRFQVWCEFEQCSVARLARSSLLPSQRPGGFERTRNSPKISLNDFLLQLSYLVSKIVHDRRNNPVSSFLPEVHSSHLLPTSGHGPAAADVNRNILRTIHVFFAPSLQRPPQCFQYDTASFFGVFQPQSFVINNIQPLFCKTGG
jgi:hypothetical protein